MLFKNIQNDTKQHLSYLAALLPALAGFSALTPSFSAFSAFLFCFSLRAFLLLLAALLSPLFSSAMPTELSEA
jgi:hypothetical protein